MSLEASTDKTLQDLELSLLQASVRSSARVAELLAEDFVEFGSSGKIYNKAQSIALLQAEKSYEFTVSQFSVKLLAPDFALLTYRAHRHSEPALNTLRSSIWVQRQGRWQIVFHQGTPGAEVQ
ncbi:MAG: DUF4440 domain-containing protein [Gallionellaceae bacterium]